MRVICLGLLILPICGSCKRQHNHGGRTPLMGLDGNFLYYKNSQVVLPMGLSKDSNLLFAEHYTRNQAERVLLCKKAKSNVLSSGKTNKLVENYQEALITRTYQRTLISQTLSKEVSETELTDYYEEHQELFKMERPLMRELFIKVPLKAPQLGNVRRWYKTETHEIVEHLERYSLQNVVKYKYFYDKQMPIIGMMNLVPLKVSDTGKYLNKNRHVEPRDAVFHYFLNTSDFHTMGEQEPYEFARTQVEDTMLNMRQMEFMGQVKEDLYRRAERREKIKYY